MSRPDPDYADDAKRSLRSSIIAQLRALTPSDRAAHSSAIRDRLTNLPEFHRARTVMGFFSTHEEPDLDPLLATLHGRQARFAAPRNNWTSREITPCLITSLQDAVAARHGLREPGPAAPSIQMPEIDLVIIPGVAFDALGNRLGRGGGFYDRFLGRPDVHALRVAVAFDLQIVADVPALPHDARMDVILTPTREIRPAATSG
jgi:5-formyltetrahydrofolate cyclo-ligase